MKEASYYEKLGDGKVHCHLCPQECKINEGKKGFCRARSNLDGVLYSDIYEHILACNLDPIEKKPLYHFYPGRLILSIGTKGCNQRCDFCQNWEMIEADTVGTYITSDEIAVDGGPGRLDRGCLHLQRALHLVRVRPRVRAQSAAPAG